MKIQDAPTHGNKNTAVSNGLAKDQSTSNATIPFADHRPEAIAQRKMQDLIVNNPQARQLKAFQDMANRSTVQPFWLREKGSVNWVDDKLLDLTKHQKTGKKQWKYRFLPAFLNEELPIYERKNQALDKGKAKSKPLDQGSSSKDKPELSSKEWLTGVKNELKRWVDERGGMVHAPKEWEFKALWATRPTGFEGKWDSWQDLRKYYQNESGVTPAPKGILPPREKRSSDKAKEKRPKEEVVNEHVRQILNEIRNAIGRYPVWTKKENPARAGCVMFGPATSVPQAYAEDVYEAFNLEEGAAFEGGRLHVVRKSGARVYNITLHRKYMQDNPQTMVNMHVDVGG